jgi:protoporphyrinogen/coproporphyrinogen III oxidase
VYDGVGIPACIASARRAADELTRDLTGGSAGAPAGRFTGENIDTPTRVRDTRSEAGQ